MRRVVAIAMIACLATTIAGCSDSDVQSSNPGTAKEALFAPTALAGDQISADSRTAEPASSENSPQTLAALIDLAYGAVVVDVTNPAPERVETENGTTLRYYDVRVVENIFGGYDAGDTVKVIMGYETPDSGSPFHFAPEFVPNERLLLFTQHSAFEETGFAYPEADEIVGATDGLFRFVGVADGESDQMVVSHGWLGPTTLEKVRSSTVDRVRSQGIDPDDYNEPRT